MAHGGRARERTRAAHRRRLLTLGGAAVPSVDPGLEHRYPRRRPKAPGARCGTGTPGMIAGCPGGISAATRLMPADSPGWPSTFLFPPPRRRELTDSSEPDEGFPHSYQALWMNAA